MCAETKRQSLILIYAHLCINLSLTPVIAQDSQQVIKGETNFLGVEENSIAQITSVTDF